MESVKDKVVLITGSSSGIGAATAVLFAKYGSKLVLTARNQEKLNRTAENCMSQGLTKDKVLVVSADVAKDDDMKRLVDTAVSTFGTIHILVNNAAGSFASTILDTSMENFDAAYMSNLRAVVFLTKLVVPYLKKNKGSIVNVTTIFSSRPCPPKGPYCVMKAGLSMVTKDLALELAPVSVRVNEVRPGAIITPMLYQFFGLEEGAKKSEDWINLEKCYPIGRVGESEEVAQAIVFLASDASSFTTGEALNLDGGYKQTAAWASLS